ncbi:MAG: hypothetical protein WBI50_08105 [Acetomicrobium sp.]
MKKFVLSLILVFSVTSFAFATVPVARTDNILEQLFLARYTEMQTWLEKIAFSITNPQTLGDLKALPEKLKSLKKDLDRFTNFSGDIRKLTRHVYKTGDAALGDLGEYINMRDIASGNFDRVLSKIENEIKDIPIDTGDGPETEDREMKKAVAASSARGVMESISTVPMSLPSIETATAINTISESPSTVARKQNVISASSGAKMNLMEEYASYIARYDGKDSIHRKKIKKILKETENIVESSKEYAEKIKEMEAQQAIARVGADQVAMLAMQNVLLANINDTLADEITLLAKIGLAETEEYANAIKKSLEDYIDIYSVIRGDK